MLELPIPSLRMMFGDTSLHAALLIQGAQIPAVHLWRARCMTLVEELQQAMRDAGYFETDIDEVSLVQCTLLDDLTLRSLPVAQRGDWMRESLQIRFHDTQDGAEIVCERIDALLLGERLTPESIELYRVALELGFKGGQAERDSYRQLVITALNKLGQKEVPQPAVRTSVETAAMVQRQGDPHRHWPTNGVILAAIAAAALWLVFNVHLDRAMARLPEYAPVVQGGSPSQGRP